MKINYIFSKDPANSTTFDIIRTKFSGDGIRTLVLKISDTNPSEKFKNLQKDDLLMPQIDAVTKNQENIMVIDTVSYIDGLYEVTLTGFKNPIYNIDEFEDDDKLVVIARVEK